MDSYSYAATCLPSSTYPQQVKKNKPLSSYHSSLHGVRRLPLKPMTKHPIAPLPPTPPKIYRVEPVDFKEVVQMLTAAPEFQSNSSNSSSGSGSSSSNSGSRRLQDVAPPPLDLSPVSLPRNSIAAEWRELLRPCSSSNNQVESISAACNDSTNHEAQERSDIAPRNLSDNIFGSCSPLSNFSLSPASFAWFSSILLSPSTLASPSTVL